MPNDTLATLVTASHSKCSLFCLICGSSLNLWLSGLCLSPYFSSDVRAWLQLCTSSCRLLTSPLLPTHHPSNVKSASTLQTQPPDLHSPQRLPMDTHASVSHHTDNAPADVLFGFCCHCSCYCMLTFLSLFFPHKLLCL